ncbi:uncharacterized protein [Phaseolus vulgaris]|uniref:uncharacterized protein isoform X2 n=1 Tax=Phaseolus vulgaris TaxID=3885 RepID=UPI0035CA7A78
MDAQIEVEDWEFLHPNDDVPLLFPAPTLPAIRHDHFALLPPDHHPNSDSNSNSNSNSNSTSNSDVDRNFDDSYVADQIFPNPAAPWTADSDSDASTAVTVPEAESVAEPAAVESLKAEEEEVKEEGEEKRLVWWKVPFEVLRCWVNPLPLPLPVWSLSVAAAAAFLGLLFLGRRLYSMKRKTQTVKLNLALDDKVSQLMGRVARLNEAFSVVRRVPIVRPPSLPASSVTLRPVMSMR